MLDRRDFLKLSGTLGLTALFGGSLIGCSSENNDEEIVEEYPDAEGKENDYYDYWTATGNKKTFEAETHLIFTTDVLFNSSTIGGSYATQRNGEINIPNGYSLVSNEPLADYGIRYVYINSVPVEALEYKSYDGETAYPFAGTPLDLEKAEEAPKIYSKTM